jgi:hypothetical protein
MANALIRALNVVTKDLEKFPKQQVQQNKKNWYIISALQYTSLKKLIVNINDILNYVYAIDKRASCNK